jgi:hypothetical protein
MEATMDLVPSERAVLKMIRMLVLEASTHTHCVTLLRSRWPALHAPAYDGGFVGLIAKRLVALSRDEQTFSVTSEGLRAMASHR